MTILVAYVPTDAGRAALTFATGEAARRGEDLHIINAGRGDAAASDRSLSESEEQFILSKMAHAGVTAHIERAVGERSIGEQVVEVADQISASVVVIGTRGRSLVGKLLLGSVALEVLSSARQPVIAVKP